MGHSMGGHGALVIGLKNPERYCSISAFAPILNPSQVPWGQKAFTAYLGSDEKDWTAWDTTSLIAQSPTAPPIHISQGNDDNFYDVQLNEEAFLKAAEGKKVSYKKLDGYDHSYFTDCFLYRRTSAIPYRLFGVEKNGFRCGIRFFWHHIRL